MRESGGTKENPTLRTAPQSVEQGSWNLLLRRLRDRACTDTQIKNVHDYLSGAVAHVFPSTIEKLFSYNEDVLQGVDGELVTRLREGARAFDAGAIPASWAPEQYPKTADAMLDSHDLNLSIDTKTLQAELRSWNPFASPKATHEAVRAVIMDRHAAMLAARAARDATTKLAAGAAASETHGSGEEPAEQVEEGASEPVVAKVEAPQEEAQPALQESSAVGQPRTLEELAVQFRGRIVDRGEIDGSVWERDSLGVVMWTSKEGVTHFDIPDRLGWKFPAGATSSARVETATQVVHTATEETVRLGSSAVESYAHAESMEHGSSTISDHLAAITRASGVSRDQMEKHGSRWSRIQTAIKERFMRVLVSKLGAMMGGITAGLFCMPFLPSLALIGGGALLGNWLLSRHYKEKGYVEGYATRVGAVHRLARIREKMEQLEPGSFAKKYPTEAAIKKKLDSMVFMRNVMANTLIAAGSGYVGLEARTGGKFGSTVVDSMKAGNWDSFWQLFMCDGGSRAKLLPWTSSEGGVSTAAEGHAQPRGMGLFNIQPHIGEKGSLFEGRLVTGGTRPFTLSGATHARVAECWRPILGSGAYLTPSGDGIHSTLHYRPGWIARG